MNTSYENKIINMNFFDNFFLSVKISSALVFSWGLSYECLLKATRIISS
jgi:hypothetical protein